MERRYAFFINLVLGLWLLVSPWVLGFANMTTPLWSHIIVGAIIALLALWRALEPADEGRAWASWVMAILGLWSVVSPWVFGYNTTVNWMLSDIIAGIIVAALAIWTAMGRRLAPGL
ncbi:MAG: hypothetical protein D6791_14485 [Chloroflexi bacterium]|nr:MAG: hypothetical protein D6791_14485 [Chloroflexota bacterium]